MNRSESGHDFELWLGHKLQRLVASAQGPSPRAAQAGYRAASRHKGETSPTMKPRILVSLASRATAGFVAIGLAAGAGGATVAATATGSVNPMQWGQRVVQIVQDCKSQRTDTHDNRTDADDHRAGADADNHRADADDHAASGARNNRGIGQCVSLKVNNNQNGQAHQDARSTRESKTPSPMPGERKGTGQENRSDHATGTGQGSGHGQGVETPPGRGAPPSPRA